MTDIDGIARRDLEQLSAFLDGELSPSEAEKLEARLAKDKQLKLTLEELRITAMAVSSLPEVRPPRSFALMPDMVPQRRAYPLLQLTTAVAALAFVVVVGADFVLSGMGSTAPQAAEQAFFAADETVEGQLEESAPLAAEAPAEAPAISPAATPIPQATVVGEAESELAAAPEAAAGADAEDEVSEGLMRAEEDAEGEEYADGDLPDRDLALAEEPIEEEALKAPLDGSLDALSAAEERAEPSLGLLRGVEIGLGVVLILLIGLTLWVRQRS